MEKKIIKKEEKQKIKIDEDFLKTHFCFGLILITNVDTIEKIKKYIAKQKDVTIVYQRLSTNALWIVEKERQGGK